MPKEHPILFSGPMVQALLARRKRQTRRLSDAWMKVKAGDTLWVRETWCGLYGYDSAPPRDIPSGEPIWYAADGVCPWLAAGKVRPGMFMPRWASRITLEATADARRERLQDISKADALAEGIQVLPLQSEEDPSAWYQSGPGEHQARSAQLSYASLWDSLHGKEAPWESNPELVVLSFKVLG